MASRRHVGEARSAPHDSPFRMDPRPPAGGGSVGTRTRERAEPAHAVAGAGYGWIEGLLAKGRRGRIQRQELFPVRWGSAPLVYSFVVVVLLQSSVVDRSGILVGFSL